MKTDANTLRECMNRYGKIHEPFLFVIDYEMKTCIFILQPLLSNTIFFEINGISNRHVANNFTIIPKIEILKAPSKKDYLKKFEILKSGFLSGNSFLANLTEAVEVGLNCTFEEIFDNTFAKYKLLLPNEFICFSPESFVKIKNDRIYTYPMKGTIDAQIKNAKQKLLENFKERAEHNTIVDLLRNDLSMVSKNVCVTKFRYIDTIDSYKGSILQTSSEIVGDLNPNWHEFIGDIIFKMLPAGSICGAPKGATLTLISQAERKARGFYTGIFGYYNGESLNSGVMIRCIEKKDGKLYFHSGGGITIYSNVESEYNEILQKIYLPIP